jgi:hypothetical protein
MAAKKTTAKKTAAKVEPVDVPEGKVKVRFVRLVYTRDPMTKVAVQAAPWEDPVYRSRYGDDKIQIVGAQDVVVDEYPDASEILEQMRKNFGIDEDTKQSHVDLVYGRGLAAEKALQEAIDASYEGDVESAQGVVDELTGDADEDQKEAREKQYVDKNGKPLESTSLVDADPLDDNLADDRVAASGIHRVTIESTDPLDLGTGSAGLPASARVTEVSGRASNVTTGGTTAGRPKK